MEKPDRPKGLQIAREAHGMLSGTEMGDRLRAIIADCRGQIADMRNWQEHVAHMDE